MRPSRRAVLWTVLCGHIPLSLACSDELPAVPEWSCEPTEIAAFPLAISATQKLVVQQVGDWWLLEPGDTSVQAIARCGETAVEVATGAALHGPSSALLVVDDTAALACVADGLDRIDLADAATTTRVSDLPGCSLADLDGDGGVFLFTPRNYEDPQCQGPSSPLFGASPPAGPLWHVPDLRSPAPATQLHACARLPVRLADGWYTHALGGAWLRLDLAGGPAQELHASASFVVPSPPGTHYAWSPDGVAAFIRPLAGADVAIGTVGDESTLGWNQTGTHLMISRLDRTTNAWVVELVDAATGARSDLAASHPGLQPCISERCDVFGHCTPGAGLGPGFALCEGSDDSDAMVYFDPAADTLTPLLAARDDAFIVREDGLVRFTKDRQLWEVDIHGTEHLIAEPVEHGFYVPLADGRHITSRSLPGYPIFHDDSSPTLDRVELLAIDPAAHTETRIITLLAGLDAVRIAPSLGAVAYTRRDEQHSGLWLHPLPP